MCLNLVLNFIVELIDLPVVPFEFNMLKRCKVMIVSG